MEIFKKLFNREKVDLNAMMAGGATIVDVRSNREYETGHIARSINIPLNEIGNNLELLKSKQPLILCCASGMRSSMAVKELKEKGLQQIVNGGGWQQVEARLEK